MVDRPSTSTPVRSTRKMAIGRLLAAIGYPERMSGDAVAFTLRVDGAEVNAEEMGGKLVLSCALTADERLLLTLAAYAAGRMLREDATLSYGNDRLFIWQEAPADADAHEMRRLFETFMDSCDWWRTRVDALSGETGSVASGPETMMIRP